LPIPNDDSSTEAETLPNYRDIDSDGDSIDDTREGYSPEDYTSPSIIKDNDGDGILNLWDKSSGGASIDPYDYDGDGLPDYLDDNSDNDQRTDMVEGNDDNDNASADSSPSGVDANKNGLDDAFDKDCKGESSINIDATSKCEERVSNGGCNTSSSDIELMYDGHQQIVGIRFSGVNIENGTTINSAYIQFTDDEGGTGTVDITISGEDINNASDFSTDDDDVSDRQKTTANVSWSPNDWNDAGESGSDQKTPNLSSIVQEIVDRGGWSSGNAMVFIFEGTSTSNKRVADYSGTKPQLIIKTDDGLRYDCGSDIALNDNDGDNKLDFRDVPDDELPVELIEFRASKYEDYVEVNWTTASEQNNDYFVVEKSQDNVNFEEIDIIYGAGNSNVILDYQAIDFNLVDGVSYYRLMQVDYDGTTSYSNVVDVRNISDEAFNVYPNPTNGQINIEVNEEVEITIYSMDGRMIYNDLLDSNSNNRIDLSNQPKGVYVITYMANSKLRTMKLIIK
jgi:hypothetical protein